MAEQDNQNVVRYLSVAFSKATEPVSSNRDAVKGSQLYDWQVEFCWMIDEIQRGYDTMAKKKVIADCNALIKEVKEVVDSQKTRQ